MLDIPKGLCSEIQSLHATAMAMAGSLAVLLTAPFFDLFVSPGPKICLRFLGLAQALLWTSQDHALTPSDCTQASQHCGCTKIFRRKH